MSRWRAAVALTLAVGIGCSVPALDLAGKKCQTDGDCTDGQSCSSAGACLSTSVISPAADSGPVDAGPPDYCQRIPPFTGTQVVDGHDDELTSLPLIFYGCMALVSWDDHSVAPDCLDTSARVGWSAKGVHLYFHVVYETGTVMVPEAGEALYDGDDFELFLKSNASVTGPYGGGSDPGALQILVAPDLHDPRAGSFTSAGYVDAGVPPASTFAVHLDTDAGGATGYAIEYFIPWSMISAPSDPLPAAGGRIDFDFALDYRQRDLTIDSEPRYQLLLSSNGNVSNNPTCSGQTPVPSCDDRTWCTPTLLP